MQSPDWTVFDSRGVGTGSHPTGPLGEHPVRSWSRARRVVILGIFGQRTTQMHLPENHEMVATLAQDGANQSFDLAVLPRRGGRNRPIANARGTKPPGLSRVWGD
jgi:hypothetical protein